MIPGRIEQRLARDVDVFSAQHAARAFAEQLGFPRRDATEIAIVASELCTNALKYAGRGLLILEPLRDPKRGPGVRIVVRDQGPPFTDFERAAEDHSDQRGPLDPASFAGRRGIGSGLAAVRRLSHACGWSAEEHGKRVWAERWMA